MSRYVLVHGAWEGAWSWEAIVPVLEREGHEVVTVELPGSVSNVKPVDEVTLDAYVSAVAEALGPDGEVVLVGHSLGGIVISQVAERFPTRIERLVYVAAFLLGSGDSAIEAMQSDANGQLLPRLVFAEDQSYAEVPEDAWREVAFHDASSAAIEAALPRLAAQQSTEPFFAKLELTDERFGSIPKSFIRASLDRVLTPALQERMIASWPVESVVTLESGHFPALSLPGELASALASTGVVEAAA